jgi:hypothetical protein
MLVVAGQIGLFDGSGMEVAATKAVNQCFAATLRTWTLGTKSLRYSLLTMERFRLLDVPVSTQVHGGSHCDEALDVGCGCETAVVGRQIDYGPLARPSSTRQSPLSDASVVG